MKRWRGLAIGLPLFWIALAAGLVLLSGSHTSLSRPGAEEEPTEPAGPLPDEAPIAGLFDILYPPPALRGGGSIGPRAPVDRVALAAWMSEVEETSPAGRLRSLYDLVDRYYERLGGSSPPLAVDGMPDEDWRDFLDDWHGWARRWSWKHHLEISLSEVWLPGEEPGVFAVAIDDGLGRIAALSRERLRPSSTRAVEGWTRSVFDRRESAETLPPIRTTGLSLILIPDSSDRFASVRIPLDTTHRAGSATVWSPDGDRIVGLAILRWEWSP